MDFRKTDIQVRNLKPRERRYDVALGNSIVCRVAATGGKSFALKVMIGGKQQRLLLGHYPATTVRTAFDKATALKAQIREGLDPRVEVRRVATRTDAPRTVADAAERYIAEHIKTKNRTSWAGEAERILRKDILPRIGIYPLRQLKRSDLAALVSQKAADLKAAGRTGTAANRLRAVISKFCGFCEEHGWLEPGLAVRLPRPVVETPRERILTAAEMGSLWTALQEVRAGHGSTLPVYGGLIAMLALTGARCSEITGLTATDVDFVAGTFNISDGKTKASIRNLPMTPVARSLLLEAAGDKEPGDLLFPLPKARTEIPSNEVSRAARKLVTALNHQAWTPHDLRRTAVSIMAEARIDGDVRRRVTGHVAQDVHGRVRASGTARRKW